MADVSAIPFINFGLSQQQQAQAGASANLENVQAQGAQIANQNAALNLQATRMGLSMLYKMPGMNAEQATNADQTNQTDASGVGSAGAPSAGGAVGAGGPGAAQTYADQSGTSGTSGPASADVDLGVSMFNPEQLDDWLRKDYQVNPMGTPEEQAQIMRMSMVSALTKNPLYIEQATRLRDMGVANRTFQAQQAASKLYDKTAAVADGGDSGIAFQLLQKVAPSTAAAITKMNPNATPEELNELAADTAAHYAAHVHQWTGREAEKREDGVYVDAKTKLPVAGLTGAGQSPQSFDEAVSKESQPVTVKNSDGTESQIPLWEYEKQQGMPINSAVDAVRFKQNAQQFIAQHQTMVRDSQTAAATAQGRPAPGQPGGAPSMMPQPGQSGVGQPGASQPGQPGASQPGQPGGGGLQPVQVTAQRAGQPGAPGASQPGAPGASQPGAAQQQPDNGMLPGVNPDAMPKIQLPAVRQGVSQSPTDAANVAMINEERKSQLQSAAQANADNAKQRSLLMQAQRELATINPRTVGPGSQYYNDFQKAITAAAGKAPNDYVNQVVLDKFLNQIGAGNVRQLLSGQRITNQEMMTFLTRGSPSTEQPLDAIKNIVNYMAADTDYDSRLQRTKIAALQRGADPFQINGALEDSVHRSDFIRQRTGMDPLSTPRGGAGVPDSGGFIPGKQYKDKNGNVATYRGNGVFN
jgi:hypothetical protein